MSDPIRCFKLTTGEEIIASVVERKTLSGDDYYVVNKPRVLVAQQTGPNQLGIVAMVPWMFSDPDGTSRIYIRQIAGTLNGETPKGLEDGYLKETSSIELASSIQGVPPQR